MRTEGAREGGWTATGPSHSQAAAGLGHYPVLEVGWMNRGTAGSQGSNGQDMAQEIALFLLVVQGGEFHQV